MAITLFNSQTASNILCNQSYNIVYIHIFKVTDFGTNWKPICDFLLVINTNLHPIMHHFQVIAVSVFKLSELLLWTELL